MSNLHKDLTDSQLHVPKGFSAASTETKCTKDASGNLVWESNTGLTDKRVNMYFNGNRRAKLVSEYTREYARTMDQYNFGNLHWTGVITPKMATDSAFWVVPEDCTVESLTIRASSTSATLACSVKLYAYRYNCTTNPTTIVEFVIVLAIDRETIDANEILCKDITSFTTSVLEKGDLIVPTMTVDAITNEDFYCQGSMLCKLT